MMVNMWTLVALCVLCVTVISAVPVPEPDPLPQFAANAPPSRSGFIPAFDEIVVESSLMVKGRSGPTNPVQRQGRTRLLVVPTPGTPLNGTSSSSSMDTSSTSTTSSEATITQSS